MSGVRERSSPRAGALGFVFLLFSLGASSRAQEAGSSPSRPHLILIVVDDVGREEFGCYGARPSFTPHIDTLAEQGRVFTRCYASSSVCTPTRFALQTGLDPVRAGLVDVFGTTTRRGVSPDFPMLAERLADAGYRNHHIGKWHLGRHRPEFLPSARGYHRSLTYSGGYLDPEIVERVTGRDGEVRERHSGHLTEYLFDGAIRALDDARFGPVFVHLSLHSAHRPCDPPAEWAERFEDSGRGRFRALIASVDHQLGRLRRALREKGLEDDTVVILTADNGPTGETSSGELRGVKAGLFENSLRVPLIVSGRAAGLGTGPSDRLVCSTDVCATLLDLAGVAAEGLDGQSFRPAPEQSLGPGDPERTLFWHQRSGWAALRGPWKVAQISFSAGRFPALFDLGSDPAESKNLAREHPEVLAGLRRDYEQWLLSRSRIPLVVDGPGPAFPLRERVSFAPSHRWESADGSFTLRTRLLLHAAPDTHRTVLQRRGAWSLSVEPDRRILVRVVDTSRDGRAVRLRSSRPLSLGEPLDVAIRILGLRDRAKDDDSESVVQLYLDGGLQDHGDFGGLPWTGAPLRVDAGAGEGSEVEVQQLEMYAVALQARVLEGLARPR